MVVVYIKLVSLTVILGLPEFSSMYQEDRKKSTTKNFCSAFIHIFDNDNENMILCHSE